MSNETNTYRCGETVRHYTGGFSALITAVCTRYERTTYELTYFVNYERREMWCGPEEFGPDSDKKQIGYH